MKCKPTVMTFQDGRGKEWIKGIIGHLDWQWVVEDKTMATKMAKRGHPLYT
jgi:hypothetical protein